MKCRGCGDELTFKDEETTCCCYNCGTVNSYIKTLSKEDLQRLDIAAGYRRVGRFDDAQQELENILENNPNSAEALFECFLNAYEIIEYSFNKDNSVKTCKCNSASSRSVDKHQDWLRAEKLVTDTKQRKQWVALSERIEAERQLNKQIKDNIPKYRAILTCDYENEQDLNATSGIYDILAEQTDVFFAPITLEDIVPEEKGRYLLQALKNPEKVPLMFVIYSNAFNYRNKAKKYFSNIAGQCREFAKVHTNTELFSVTSDCEASPIMKRISVKTIHCADLDEESYENIANAIMDNIAVSAYSDEEYDQYVDGEIVMLNEDLGLSPIIEPLD